MQITHHSSWTDSRASKNQVIHFLGHSSALNSIVHKALRALHFSMSLSARVTDRSIVVVPHKLIINRWSPINSRLD